MVKYKSKVSKKNTIKSLSKTKKTTKELKKLPKIKSKSKSKSQKTKTRKTTKKLIHKKFNDDKKKKKKSINIYENSDNVDDKKKKKKSINIYVDDKKKKKKSNTSLLSGSLTGTYDDKNKKVENIDIEKQKKIIEKIAETKLENMTDEDQKNIKLDSMKKTLCNLRYGNFHDIDVSDRTPYWGLGIEHEMQLFHKSQSGMKNTNILFDSQESACFLTHEKDESGSCCKNRKYPYGKCDDFSEDAKKYKNINLTEEERIYLLNMDWELTGRQFKDCEKKGRSTKILERANVLMPELISTNFSNRSIDSIANEILTLEKKYIDIHMKNPHTKQKVAKYGPITTHNCGSHSELRVPEHPTIYSKDYKFTDHKVEDYLGSYHMTITLPHHNDISTKDFVNMHQHTAQQIQWLEPLMMTAFFSPAQSGVGNKNEPEGSFRVMKSGWGNFAGSDIRVIGSHGLDRGSNIKKTWRKGLNFTGSKKLNDCIKKAPVQYKKSKTVQTGDFRTFGVESDIEKCKLLYNPNDCNKGGRADGAPMKPPFGMEIRIFDHFPAEYLIELMRIIILIAANAQRHAPTQYVYNDKRWISSIHAIMKDGWNAKLDYTYVNALKENLGLPINTTSVLAYDIFKQIVKELYDINKDSYINKIMNENPEIEPKVPELNRMCWELAFTQKYNIQMINLMKKNFYNEQKVTIKEFSKMLKTDTTLDFEYWNDNINDLLYALETNNHVNLEVFNGKIQSITILL
jgi:hypothetical protein